MSKDTCVCLFCYKVSETFEECKCDKKGYPTYIHKIVAEQIEDSRKTREWILELQK